LDMIRQQAFAGKGKMLKGNLHCHSTRSDGGTTPEDVIRHYYEHGYDFLALTDHCIYNYVHFVPELPITIIPGMEYERLVERGKGFRCYHTVCIGPSKEDGNGFEQDDRFERRVMLDKMEDYQDDLDMIHGKNNLTIYAHPIYSSTPPRYFAWQKGNTAMEIWNTGTAWGMGDDVNAAYWDDVLGMGNLIYGVAVDDSHNVNVDACGGWVSVNAENNIHSILTALKKGAFYSSCGPEIYDFYVKDDIAVVECSPAKKVQFCSDMHNGRYVKAGDGTITKAELDLKNNYNYIRAVIIDEEGRFAWTNPIFLDDRIDSHNI